MRRGRQFSICPCAQSLMPEKVSNPAPQNDQVSVKKNGVWDKVYNYGPMLALLVVVLTQKGHDIKEWITKMINRLSGQKNEDQKIDFSRLNRKLQAVDAKFFGSTACRWTVKQLDDLKGVGVDFVDCDKDPAACETIQAYPTWSIGGVQKPGYMPPATLENLLDTLLIASYESTKDKQEETNKPDDKANENSTEESVPVPKDKETVTVEEKSENITTVEEEKSEEKSKDDEDFELGLTQSESGQSK